MPAQVDCPIHGKNVAAMTTGYLLPEGTPKKHRVCVACFAEVIDIKVAEHQVARAENSTD